MSNWRRFAIAATATAVSLLVPAAATAGQAPGQADDDSPPVTIAEQIVPGGGPVEIVHSWALAPAGSEDPTEAGNRPNLSYVADAGAVIEDAVTLYNYGNEQLTFRVYATDAFNTADGQVGLLPGTESPTDVGSWITSAQEFVTVAPGGQATMPITLTIPDDATPGDHTGAVLASNEAQSAGPDGDTVKLDRRTGTRLFVRVNGPLNTELAVEGLSTSYHPALNPLDGSAQVTYRIANRGNVRLSGSSSVSISGPFGLGKVEGPAADFPELLPGSAVSITTDIDDVPSLGVVFTTVRLDPADDRAEVAVSSGNTVTFAPPIAVLLGLFALLFALLAIRSYGRHRSQDLDGDPEVEFEVEFEPDESAEFEPDQVERQPT